MKFISCASYYGTGSSAVTDLISEYDNVYSFTDEEIKREIGYCPECGQCLEWSAEDEQ